MPRLRIAFFSPFNPQKTGVSDYSEELLPYLGDQAEVDLVADRLPLANAALAGRFRVLRAQEFLANRGRYDMAVYQVANSFSQHAYMIPCMQACPGIVVLHDYYLHHLVMGLTLLEGDFPALLQILRPVYGDGARSLAWRLLLSLADPYQVSLTAPLTDMALAVVTHSRIARDLVLRDRPDKPVRIIPMAMPEIRTDERAALRRKYGIGEDEFVLASVSTLSYTKRIEVVLAAVAALAERHPGLRLWILGGGSLSDRARRTITSPALAGRTRLTGWTPAETYQEQLVAADAVVDLRYPSGAETSASLLRALAAGKPAIVSLQGSFRELPDSFTRKIPVGPGEQEQLSAAISELISNPSLCQAMSSAALGYARSEMRLERAARAYLDLVRELKERPAPPLQAPPLRSHAGAGQRLAWGLLYRVSRVGYLVRAYGWSVALERIRGEARAGGAA